MICNTGDIVVVPFPFTDRQNAKRRPALVLSHNAFNKDHKHTLLAMITTATHTQWKSDCLIKNLKPTALPCASIVRMKLFTLDNRIIIKRLGTVHEKDRKSVQMKLKKSVLGLS